MSTAEAPEISDFAKTAATLLKEYCEKVAAKRRLLRRRQQACDAASSEADPSDKPKITLLRDLLDLEIQSAAMMRSALERMARRVSQHLEHSALSDSAKLEVELRLAEMEESTRMLAREAQAIKQWVSTKLDRQLPLFHD